MDEPIKKEEEKEAQQQPQEDVAKLKEERDQYLAGWQRAKADFINHKKDELKRLSDISKYGQEDLMRELITVMDNFDLGLRSLEKNGHVEKGVYMIRTQLEDILCRNGLSRIQLKPGDIFDPGIAEAIAEVESDGPPGTVVEEIEPGYMLHEKLIRPARVTIAKEKNK